MATIHTRGRPRPPHRQGGRRRLRQPGPRTRAEPARLGRRGRGRPARGQRLPGGGRGGRARRAAPSRRRSQARRSSRCSLPDQVQPEVYAEQVAPNLEPDAALLFAHGFNVHYGRIEPPDGPRRDHGRAEGPGPRRPPALHRGLRHAGARRGRAGRERERAFELALAYAAGIGADARRACSRRRSRRRPRPTSSASRPCSAAASRELDPRRLRDARRGGLPAGDRVLRVPARAEADRRPDLRGGPRGTCAGRSRTRPSTATHARPAGRSTTTCARTCAACSPRSATARSRASGSPRWTRASRASRAARGGATTSGSRRRPRAARR